MTEPGGQVQYSVKELLQEIRDDVKGMARTLDAKADKAEVVHVVTRLMAVEDEQKAMKVREEQRTEDLNAGTEHRRWLIPLIVTTAVLFLQPLWLIILGHFTGAK